MNRLILFAAALLAASQVSAGVHIETVSRDIRTHVVVDRDGEVILLQDGKIRSTHEKPSSTTIISGATFYVLDDEKKTYYFMDDAAIKKAARQGAAMLKEMQQRVKKMPPERREMMERNMGALMPDVFGRKDTYEWKDTGKNETVDVRECRLWNLLKNGTVTDEFCVVPYATLPGNEDFAKANTDLWNAFVAGTAGVISTADYAKARKSLDGYPVRIRSFDADGNLRASEIVMTQWVEESLPTSTFEIPVGYMKEAPPDPGR